MKFTKEMAKMLELFSEHKTLRIMYYAGIGVAYAFGVATLINAVRWW
jgi:hypothetical protein